MASMPIRAVTRILRRNLYTNTPTIQFYYLQFTYTRFVLKLPFHISCLHHSNTFFFFAPSFHYRSELSTSVKWFSQAGDEKPDNKLGNKIRFSFWTISINQCKSSRLVINGLWMQRMIPYFVVEFINRRFDLKKLFFWLSFSFSSIGLHFFIQKKILIAHYKSMHRRKVRRCSSKSIPLKLCEEKKKLQLLFWEQE